MKQINITNLCEIQVGKTPSRSNPLYWGDGSLWLSIADMNQGSVLENTKETITATAIKDCNCKVVPQDTVLFSFKLSIGKVGITKIPMYTNEAIAAFIIKDHSKIDKKFLFYALKSVDHSIGSNKAVMGKTLNKEQLKKIEIPLFPLADQERIVKILDDAEILRQKRKQTVSLLDDYLNSVFSEMFGVSVRNPKGWPVMNLSEVTKKITDGTHQSPKFENDGIPFIFISNIIDNEIKLDTSRFISECTYSELTKKTPICKGDILYTTVGSYGNPAIVKTDDKFCFQRHIAHIKPDSSKTNVVFLYGMLKSTFFRRQVDQKVRGVAQKTLNLVDLKSLQVFLPPMELQEKFAMVVQVTEQLKQKMLAQSEELDNQFQALMQKAFKGEL